MKTYEADSRFPEENAEQGKIAVLTTRWNSFITDNLLTGATKAMLRNGVPEDQIEVFRVPGAFELPVTAQRVLATQNYVGLIALGCVIRGGTPHFEYVSGGCMDGLMRVQLDSSFPVGFGVLTVDTTEQAIERSGDDANNKGAEAALTVLEMLNLLRDISQ
jgi:6,7-dimethyl-8-ribityllumazine synthase